MKLLLNPIVGFVEGYVLVLVFIIRIRCPPAKLKSLALIISGPKAVIIAIREKAKGKTTK